jgi:hypothetical protein
VAGSDHVATLTALNEGLIKLQRSARNTIPMFVVGIIATVIAAGVALYYILTLSAGLADAQLKLGQSERALAEANAKLSSMTGSLRRGQQSAKSQAEADTFATAISEASGIQASLTNASTSLRQAAAKLESPESKVRREDRLATSSPDKRAQAPAFRDPFEVVETSDGFLSLRVRPDIRSAEIRQVPSGSILRCGKASGNESGNLWRPCTDDQGHSGYVSARYLRNPQATRQASLSEDRFEVVETSDHFLSLRVSPDVRSAEIRKIPSGTVLLCGDARSNEAGSLWRPCKDDQDNSGFVSNRYVRKL